MSKFFVLRNVYKNYLLHNRISYWLVRITIFIYVILSPQWNISITMTETLSQAFCILFILLINPNTCFLVFANDWMCLFCEQRNFIVKSQSHKIKNRSLSMSSHKQSSTHQQIFIDFLCFYKRNRQCDNFIWFIHHRLGLSL